MPAGLPASTPAPARDPDEEDASPETASRAASDRAAPWPGAGADRPLSVCVVVPYDLAEEGGVKRHAFHVAEALRKLGDRVTVIGPSSTPRGGDDFHGFGGIVNIPANGSDNRLGLLVRPWQVRDFFRERRFDVVHVHEPLQPALNWWALRYSPGAAHVATFHGFSEHEGFWLGLARRAIAPRILPGFDRAIAVSRPAERFALRVWRGPLAVIPNGVPVSLFHPGGRTAGSAPTEDAPLKLLFVGHWRDPRKGLTHLLAAHALLRKRGVAVTIDVVGDGPAGVRVPEAPGVTFHGAISDERRLAETYRQCDVFIAPATGQESFGIVLLEAMASARPVVCSSIDGFHEAITGEGARFVPPGDAGAIAAAIEEIARDPVERWRMSLANRRRAESFDWQRIAVRVRGEYLHALGRAESMAVEGAA